MQMRKKLIPILLAVIMLTATAYAAEAPPPVQADESAVVTVTDITPQEKNNFTGTLPEILPLDVQLKDEGGSTLLVKTFEVPPDTAPQELVEENLARGGVEYTLREILKETLQSGTDSRAESKTVTVSADSDKTQDILPLLSESLDYNEDGYTGKLSLDADSIKTEVESTKAYSYTVSDTRSYTGLARNDPALIDKTVLKNGLTLSLCNIKWSGGSENDPSPIYSATAYYAGKASGQTADGYLVTASYSGEVSKTTPGDIRYRIIYEPIQPPVLPEIPKDFDWSIIMPVVLTVIGTASLAAAVFFALRFLRARKKDTGFDTGMAELKPKRRKPHALGYLKRDGGQNDA